MTDTLIVLLAGAPVGKLIRARNGDLTFRYDDTWRTTREAIPLSLSMPLTSAVHGTEAVEPFLWGLLPDNEIVLTRWAQRFQVSARNVFALITHVGEDCAGAVQFVRPERLDVILNAPGMEVEWLSEGDVAARLRDLRADHAAWRLPRDNGQFSLAGAQPKTALLLEGGRWGIPSGQTPTTHILKPPTGEFDGHAENEHFCLVLARAVGLPTAASQVMRFEDEVAIVVERYDRVRTAGLAASYAARVAAYAASTDDPSSAGKAAATAAEAAAIAELAKTRPILRAHQEDLCQALGCSPTNKYQNDGGPGPAEIIRLLRNQSSAPGEDVDAFVDALAFNWLIGGTDAHAKNYSVLIAGGGRVRLAPLYDLASILPYRQFDLQKVKLAMTVGGKYRWRDIGRRQWIKLAEEVRLDVDGMLGRLSTLATRVISDTPSVVSETRRAGIAHAILGTLEDSITERATRCLAMLQPTARA